MRYAAAFATVAPPGDILVGRDSRPSGRVLSMAIHAALQPSVETPSTRALWPRPLPACCCATTRAAGAIQITASHNPPPYNGMKLFSADGRVIPAAPGKAVLDRYRIDSPPWTAHDRTGDNLRCDDTVSAHLLAVLATVDAERIRERRFRVLLDSNHGAGSILGGGCCTSWAAASLYWRTAQWAVHPCGPSRLPRTFPRCCKP